MCPTCSCRFVCVSSSAFFSSEDTHSFLFCRQRVAAALLRSRNFCLRSSGSCSVVLLRRFPPPPLLQLLPACTACCECKGGEHCICCETGDNWIEETKCGNLLCLIQMIIVKSLHRTVRSKHPTCAWTERAGAGGEP